MGIVTPGTVQTVTLQLTAAEVLQIHTLGGITLVEGDPRGVPGRRPFPLWMLLVYTMVTTPYVDPGRGLQIQTDDIEWKFAIPTAGWWDQSESMIIALTLCDWTDSGMRNVSVEGWNKLQLLANASPTGGDGLVTITLGYIMAEVGL